MTRKRIRSYEKVKSRYGYVFISIWLVGFLAFFLTPFITSIVYSFCDMEINPGDVRLTFVGFCELCQTVCRRHRIYAGFHRNVFFCCSTNAVD